MTKNKQSGEYIVKIADFGLSKMVNGMTSTKAGTAIYSAP